MRTWLDKRIGALGDESGLTIIEVLVAAVVLVLGSAATFGMLGAATKNAQRAKATQVALDLAQEELERLHGLPYDSIALNSLPTSSSSPLNPNYRVKTGTFALDRNPIGDYGTLVLDTEKGISPESEFFSGDQEASGVTGTLHRYVVWRNDPTCSDSVCPGSQDYKQIVVAVKPSKPVSQSGERGYVEVQSELIDPDAYEVELEEGEGNEEEEADPGDEDTAQQFFLSDTPCESDGSTARKTITADHLLHNTLGTCASGLKTGSEAPGAPDALLLTGPPDPDPEDETNPAFFDYADDFYLEPTPDTDKGVQIRRDDTSGCHYDPAGVTNPESQIHRWVSDPLSASFAMSGKVTLEFYTRTLNDALYTGALCVFLFERQESGSPAVATDTLLTSKGDGDPYWVYGEGSGYWPRNAWTRVRLTMESENLPRTVVAGRRIGVALGVERGLTQADAIPIIYDHPSYPTRLEVETTTPIEGG